jgi:hypothetical protein
MTDNAAFIVAGIGRAAAGIGRAAAGIGRAAAGRAVNPVVVTSTGSDARGCDNHGVRISSRMRRRRRATAAAL